MFVLRINFLIIFFFCSIFIQEDVYGLAPSSSVQASPDLLINDLFEVCDKSSTYKNKIKEDENFYKNEKYSVLLRVPSFWAFLWLIIFIPIFIITKYNLICLIIIAIALAPFAYKTYLYISKKINKNVELFIDNLLHSLPFLFVSFFILFVTGVLNFMEIEGFETLKKILFVIDLIGVILFALPIIWDGFVSLIRGLEDFWNGNSFLSQVGDQVLKGMALFILLLVPVLVPAFPSEIAFVALIGIVIKVIERFQGNIIKIKDSFNKNFKKNMNSEIKLINEKGEIKKVLLEELQENPNDYKDFFVKVDINERVPEIEGEIYKTDDDNTWGDKSFVTGEATEYYLQKGDKISEGIIIRNGGVRIKVTSIGEDTDLGKIKTLLNKNSLEKFPEVKVVLNRLAKVFFVLIIFLAVIGPIVTGKWRVSVAVLITISSCPLMIGVPLAFSAAIRNMSSKGLFILDNSSFITNNVFIFDKTGTLTKGCLPGFRMLDIWTEDVSTLDEDREELQDKLLLKAAKLEMPLKDINFYSNVIVNKAFFRCSRADLLSEKGVESFVHGNGYVTGTVDDQDLFLGSIRSFQEHRFVDLDKTHAFLEKAEEMAKSGRTPMIFYDRKNNKFLAIFSVKEILRDDIETFVNKIKILSKKRFLHRFYNFFSRLLFRFEAYPSKTLSLVLSGDTKDSVKHLLKEGKTGITFGISEANSYEKTLFISWIKSKENMAKVLTHLDLDKNTYVFTWKEFKEKFLISETGSESQERNHVLKENKTTGENNLFMIGDGPNDSLPLGKVNTAVSFGQGSVFAKFSASVLIQDQKNVFKLLTKFFTLKRNTWVVVFINLFVGVILWNVVLLVLIYLEILHPVAEVIMHFVNLFMVIGVTAFLLPIRAMCKDILLSKKHRKNKDKQVDFKTLLESDERSTKDDDPEKKIDRKVFRTQRSLERFA